MIEAENLHLGVLVDHLDNAFVHLGLQLVVAEIESEQAFQRTDGVDDIGRLVIENFQLLHLKILNATVRVAEKLLKDLDFLSTHQHAINTKRH